MIRYFIFNDPSTTEIYTLSLHDALPISFRDLVAGLFDAARQDTVSILIGKMLDRTGYLDRKSTRLNSSHSQISYAVFCLKKKTTSGHLLQLPLGQEAVVDFLTHCMNSN